MIPAPAHEEQPRSRPCRIRGAGTERPEERPVLTARQVLGDGVGVVPQGGRAAATVVEPCGCVPHVEPAGEELARGVMPSAVGVESYSGRVRSISDAVRDPVRVPPPVVRWSLENRYASYRYPITPARLVKKTLAVRRAIE
jgi:hypothetical protein